MYRSIPVGLVVVVLPLLLLATYCNCATELPDGLRSDSECSSAKQPPGSSSKAGCWIRFGPGPDAGTALIALQQAVSANGFGLSRVASWKALGVGGGCHACTCRQVHPANCRLNAYFQRNLPGVVACLSACAYYRLTTSHTHTLQAIHAFPSHGLMWPAEVDGLSACEFAVRLPLPLQCKSCLPTADMQVPHREKITGSTQSAS